MNFRKEYIPCDCVNDKCSHYKDPCCRVCTEIVKTKNTEEIDILFMGMGAGKDEDFNINPRNSNRQPFYGRAGKYLRQVVIWMLDTFGEFNFALSNNVRCHPMDENGKDREPTTEEINNCLINVLNDINKIKPKAIVTVGRNATISMIGHTYNHLSVAQLRSLTGLSKKVGSLTVSIFPTYHPSFLCRTYGTFVPDACNEYDVRFISNIQRALAA